MTQRDDAHDTARLAAALVFTAAVAFAVSPFIVSGFRGFEPDQFPIPQDQPPVQPAGYAFSIWGPIYLWLVVHAGAGLFARSDALEWQPMRWPLFISLGVGASWIAVAQLSPIMATILIWVMLAGALLALLRAPSQDRFLARAPVGLYAGWLTAASCVALGLVGAGYGIGPDATIWAVMALVTALVMATAIQLRRPDTPEYGVAVIWALVAVAVANWGALWLVTGLALAGAVLIAAIAARAALQRA